jgi:hypothetical protein
MFEDLIQQFIIAFGYIGLALKYFIYWAPFFLGYLLWKAWRKYMMKKFLSEIKWVLLEVRIPKDIRRSPKAMELVLNALHQPGTGNWYERLMKGKVPDWFSLEIVSIEGSIHFYMRVAEGYKNYLEAQIYSQFPSAEVSEVADYAKQIAYSDGSSEWQPTGMEFAVKGEDALPIATYVDFGLDKEGVKEEERIDPLTTVLETLGTAKKGEQFWIQICIQGSQTRFHKKGTWREKEDWKAQGKALIKEIQEGYKDKDSKVKGISEQAMSAADKEKIKAITRNISKSGFDCGIRTFYWVRSGTKFDGSKAKALGGIFSAFQHGSYNFIKVCKGTKFDYPWQDFKNMRVEAKKRRMFNAYKRRGFFYPPYKTKLFVLNTEELATLFHFPGMVAETPTFGRIESRKGEPPANLPI